MFIARHRISPCTILFTGLIFSSGCEPDDGDSTSTIDQGSRFRFAAAVDTDVMNYRLSLAKIDCEGQSPGHSTSLQTWDVDVVGPVDGGGGIIDDPLSQGSVHVIGQVTVPLEPGCYAAQAFPKREDDQGTVLPSQDCLPSFVDSFYVAPREISELTMISNCPAEGISGGDVAIAGNRSPTLAIVAGTTTVAQCDTLRVCVEASDPDGDPLEFVWDGVGIIDATPVFNELSDTGVWTSCADLRSTVAGQPRVHVDVYDLLDNGSRVQDHPSVLGPSSDHLAIPLHVTHSDANCEGGILPQGVRIWGWTQALEGQLRDVATDAAGDFYACGSMHQTREAVILKFAGSTGQLLWDLRIPSPNVDGAAGCNAVTQAADGGVVALLGLFAQGDDGAMLARISPDASVTSTPRLEQGLGSRAEHVVVGDGGRMYVGGMENGDGVNRAWVAEYQPSGQRTWSHTLPFSAVQLADLELGPDGALTTLASVPGPSGQMRGFVAQLMPGDSTPRWIRVIDDVDNWVQSMALTATNRLIISAQVRLPTPGQPHTHETWVRQYPNDSTSNPDWSYRVPATLEASRSHELARGIDDDEPFRVLRNALEVDTEGRIILGGIAPIGIGNDVPAVVFLNSVGEETGRSRSSMGFQTGLTVSNKGVAGIIGFIFPTEAGQQPDASLEAYSTGSARFPMFPGN